APATRRDAPDKIGQSIQGRCLLAIGKPIAPLLPSLHPNYGLPERWQPCRGREDRYSVRDAATRKSTSTYKTSRRGPSFPPWCEYRAWSRRPARYETERRAGSSLVEYDFRSRSC